LGILKNQNQRTVGFHERTIKKLDGFRQLFDILRTMVIIQESKIFDCFIPMIFQKIKIREPLGFIKEP
jgi:hypothetical protein